MVNNSLPGLVFKVATPDAALQDLKQRLSHTRLPAEQITSDWSYGTPLAYAERLRNYWLRDFDWKLWERRINRFEQRLVDVDGSRIHVLIEKGSGANPLPLVLTHGWPGSFLEFIDIIEPLAHPELFGGAIEDAFTVILPSLPGYGYSSAPARPLSPKAIASLWNKIAVDHFRFDAYAAQGGDWGSAVTANLALYFPERLVAIHLNTGGMTPTVDETSAPLLPQELEWMSRARAVMAPESGYQQIQATKPQSLAYAQTDSPLGLACWIVEKFQGWTVPGQAADPPFDMDWLLANVMLYWLNGSNAPSWLYTFLNNPSSLSAPPGARIEIPTAFTLFPKDLVVPAPRPWLERLFNVRRYHMAADGGHFPMLENKQLMLREIRQSFAEYR